MGGLVGVVHVHSDYSHDGQDTLERLREFALERGIAFICLTDHAEDFGPIDYPSYVEYCRSISDRRVRLIPGLEYRFVGYPGLHLLALGLHSWIAPKTPAEFVDQTHGVAGFTIVAHPVLASYQIPAEVLAGIDAIEVWNASYNTRYLPDPSAIRLLHQIRVGRPEVVGIVGLDQHDASNDRQTRVILSDRGDEEPLQAIRDGRFYNLGSTMSFHPAVPWSPLRVAGLTAARWIYDGVERMQEFLMHKIR